MEMGLNRAEQLWQLWEEKQQQLEKLIGAGPDSATAIQQSKYEFLRNGYFRITAQPAENEKLHLHAIKLVTDKLQKKLYPNPLIRILHRIKSLVYDRPMHLRQFRQQKAECLESLTDKFKQLGLSSYSGRLEKYLDYESQQVSIPMTTQLPDKGTLDIDVQLVRDKVGQYQFIGYKATVKRQETEERSQLFKAETSVNAMQAVNLLAGRAVKQSYEMADGNTGHKWLQLDLATPALGGYKVNEYHNSYSLDKAIADLAVVAGLRGLNKREIIIHLEQGHQLSIQGRSPLNEQLYVQANPSDHTLMIFDKERKPLAIDELAEKKAEANKHHAEKTLVLIKPQAKETEQAQSLGIG